MKKSKIQKNKVFIALGSNLGDRELNLKAARQHIEAKLGSVSKASSVYRTEPWGYQNQPDFLNQVIEIHTRHNPEQILKELLSIEADMGRKRTFKNASRIIDLDILFFANQVVQHSDMTIPHPRMTDRRFVLQPMSEIAPDFIHPVLHKAVSTLLAACTDPLKVEKIQDNETALLKNQNQETGE